MRFHRGQVKEHRHPIPTCRALQRSGDESTKSPTPSEIRSGTLPMSSQWIAVAQSGRRLEDLTLGDQHRAHRVPQPVQTGPGDTSLFGESIEPVAQTARQNPLTARIGREQPGTLLSAGHRMSSPRLYMLNPI
ncbi:hypothetical protein, partial [Actinophytocola sp.]|uniref:hypothetical protein n=1 Tax=Actinophytocola sp. TaxID=1872138 RepID=UPI002DB82F36